MFLIKPQKPAQKLYKDFGSVSSVEQKKWYIKVSAGNFQQERKQENSNSIYNM